MMQQKTYLLTVTTIFSIIAVLHILRLILGWPAVIGEWEIPVWLSWVAFIIAGFLAYEGFTFGTKKS